MHGLWASNLFGDGECKRGVGMLDLPYKLKFTELEHGRCCVLLLPWLLHSRVPPRNALRRMHCREVQDERRECRVHGLWCGYLFGDGRRKRGVGMLDLPYKLKFTEL